MRRLLGIAIIIGACAPDESIVTEEVQQCSTQTIEGVDVYSGTGTIDWTKVKASGREFAFIKATQGNYNKQATFTTLWSGAAAAGILRSPYHFFDPTNDGVAQATWFLDEITAAGGLQPNDLAPMLDIECPTSSSQAASQANCEHAGDSGWVPTATMSQRIFDWLAAVKQATGRTPIIYSYPSWFASVAFTDIRLADYPLFIASYATCANVPAPWTKAVFWQYSATTSVPGIAAPGDVDRFFGSAGDLVGMTGSATPDAGVPLPDGDIAPDGGNAATGGAAGCGCQSGGSPASLVLFGAVLLVVRRSRRRR
jgi:lysozyme